MQSLIFKLLISQRFGVLKDNEKTILGNEIKKQITYNNINDKFELLEYEKNIIKTLSESISSEIVVSITTLNSDL